MQITQKIWNSYWAYGIKHGLSRDGASDFAQEVCLEVMKLGFEPKLLWVFADYMRRTRGRPELRGARDLIVKAERLRSLDAFIAPDGFDDLRLFTWIFDEVLESGIYHSNTVRDLARWFRMSVPEMSKLIRTLFPKAKTGQRRGRLPKTAV